MEDDPMTDRTKTLSPCGPRPALQTGPAQPCPACGGTIPGTARGITDRYGWSWSLHTCYQCHVQYQARPMTDEARRDFYASGRYRQVCARVTGQPWTDPDYLRQAQQAYADRWAQHIPALRGHVLDYGGSTGVVSASWCASADVTVADYGDGATTTPEQALAVPDGTYDAILCCQTLDHLPGPLNTLRAFLRVAKPGARLFVDVVKLAHTAYKLDHDTYYPSGSAFLALVERSGWRPIWLDAETHPTHYSILAEKACPR
jgi:SAM-dependent methyltransferase